MCLVSEETKLENEDMKSRKYPPYKASGMAYIRFAKEELKQLLKSVQQILGLDEESAYLFHLEMWIYVHGIATMLVTSYFAINPPDECPKRKTFSMSIAIYRINMVALR